ncbi:MAG: DUF192 domain-containing protein [Planctomycetes bacterium]|nr:DUF192 domain-containing protein [Planctomycetota bacterium]
MRLLSDDGTVVADRLQVARTTRERARGLLGRARFEPGEGLLLERCRSIHTCFMRFPIDVAYVDADRVVVKAVAGLAPWRVSGSLLAEATVELPAGTLARHGLAPGARLRVEP